MVRSRRRPFISFPWGLPVALTLLSASIHTACGGGGADPETAVLATVTARTGLVNLAGGVAIENIQVIDRDNTPARAFIGFSLASIPAGAIVQSALLRLDVVATVGDPIATLGPVVLDHVDLGVGLSADDFATAASASAFANAVTDLSDGPREVDVAQRLQVALDAGTGFFDLRLRFALGDADGDGSTEAIAFRVATDDPLPTIEVTYR
jgi:hypothetical protein